MVQYKSHQNSKVKIVFFSALCCMYVFLDLLHQKDYAIRCLCDDKFNASLELLELFAKDELFGGVSFMPRFYFFFSCFIDRC